LENNNIFIGLAPLVHVTNIYFPFIFSVLADLTLVHKVILFYDAKRLGIKTVVTSDSRRQKQMGISGCISVSYILLLGLSKTLFDNAM